MWKFPYSSFYLKIKSEKVGHSHLRISFPLAISPISSCYFHNFYYYFWCCYFIFEISRGKKFMIQTSVSSSPPTKMLLQKKTCTGAARSLQPCQMGTWKVFPAYPFELDWAKLFPLLSKGWNYGGLHHPLAGISPFLCLLMKHHQMPTHIMGFFMKTHIFPGAWRTRSSWAKNSPNLKVRK